MRKAAFVVAAALVAAAGTGWAHHGWGSYDASKPIAISAPIEMVEWANPHAHVMLRHQGALWEATLAPLSRMESRGLSADMLKPGTPVVIEGYPSTRNANELRAERITTNGKTVELR